jgi:hypothetical protein
MDQLRLEDEREEVKKELERLYCRTEDVWFPQNQQDAETIATTKTGEPNELNAKHQ